MAHFAELDQNNMVLRVIVVDNNDIMIDGVESESAGINFINSIPGMQGRWIQCSANKKFRKNFPTTGMFYDEDTDEFLSLFTENSWKKFMIDKDLFMESNKYILTDGFARSGNMFLLYLLRFAFPQCFLRQGYLIPHDTSSLTPPTNKFDIIIVPIRNPEDSIKSYISFFDVDISNENNIIDIAKENLKWMKAIKENKNNIHIINFNLLKDNPEIVLSNISQILNIQVEDFNIQEVYDCMNIEGMSNNLPNENTSNYNIDLNKFNIHDIIQESTNIYQEIIANG